MKFRKGQQVGKFTVLKAVGYGYYLVRCSICSREREVQSPTLADNLGKTKECYCSRVPALRRSHTKHGARRTKLYAHWDSMKQRCYRPKTNGFKDYGGRGIGVCLRWRSSFASFRADMGPTFFSGATLDRIDTNGHYTPENCRWATAKEQARNRRVKRPLTFQGVRWSFEELAAASNISRSTLLTRIRRGWSLARATIGVKKHRYEQDYKNLQ